MKQQVKIGDSVKVKSKIFDPFFKKYCLTNWQGRIRDIDKAAKPYIEISWDSITLSQMPSEYVEFLIDGYCDYSILSLNLKEVELSEPRDTLNDVEKKKTEMNEQYGYITDEEHEANIRNIIKSKVLSVTSKKHDKFFDYLIKHVEHPCILTGAEDFSWEEPYLFGFFDKKEYEHLKKTRPSYTDHFKLLRIAGIEDLRGILVEVLRISDEKKFVLPLWDLKTVERNKKNHQLISYYSYWMSNFR